MGPVIGHVGARVSALLDGHLDAEETERAWSHVHTCHGCRDLVEREGALKRRLSRLSSAPGPGAAPAHLKGSLLTGVPLGAWDTDIDLALGGPPAPRGRRAVGFATVGGGAVGAAVLGVLALGASPADAPSPDRRLPVTQLAPAVPGSPSGFTPAAVRGRDARR